MNSSYFSFFDMAIAGVPALGFAIWQLISINREIAKDTLAKDRAATATAPSPESARHPVGEHRLDNR